MPTLVEIMDEIRRLGPDWAKVEHEYDASRPQLGEEQKRKEQAFQSWYAGHAKAQGLNPNPDDPQHFYDYRAAYRAGATPSPDGHWPSQFKLEGHPRMIIDGVNTKTGQPSIVDPNMMQQIFGVKPRRATPGVRGSILDYSQIA